MKYETGKVIYIVKVRINIQQSCFKIRFTEGWDLHGDKPRSLTSLVGSLMQHQIPT